MTGAAILHGVIGAGLPEKEFLSRVKGNKRQRLGNICRNNRCMADIFQNCKEARVAGTWGAWRVREAPGGQIRWSIVSVIRTSDFLLYMTLLAYM